LRVHRRLPDTPVVVVEEEVSIDTSKKGEQQDGRRRGWKKPPLTVPPHANEVKDRVAARSMMFMVMNNY
jgi:hypothetical protein